MLPGTNGSPRSQRGFSLIELMFALVVMSIIAIPASSFLLSLLNGPIVANEYATNNSIDVQANTARDARAPTAGPTAYDCADWTTAVAKEATADDPSLSQCNGDSTITSTFGGTGAIPSSTWAVEQDLTASKTVTLALVHVGANQIYSHRQVTTYTDSALKVPDPGVPQVRSGWSGTCPSGQSPTTARAIATTNGDPCS